MYKKIVSILLAAFIVPNFVWADEASSKIFIASDFHLFPPGFDFNIIQDIQRRESQKMVARTNQQTWNSMVLAIKNDPLITSVILNGDLYHAPIVSALDDERRIEMMINLLVDTQEQTRKPIYFNLGNHDLKATVGADGHLAIDAEFSKTFAIRFKRAVEERKQETSQDIPLFLVGLGQPGFGDYKSVFELEIDRKKIKISHNPFVRTKAIVEQAQVFATQNGYAYRKVTSPPLLEENRNNILHVFSDTHTPAHDDFLRVYNSGATAVDLTLPYKTPTFLIVEGDSAQHYTLKPEIPGKAVKYEVPKIGSYCHQFYR